MSPATALAPAPTLVVLVHRTTRRPPWARVAPLLPAALAGVLQLLAPSPVGSPFAAAAWAGSRSWTAWASGSFDTAGAVGVDGPPAALWVAGSAVRVLGSSTTSLLLPQVVAAALAVGLLTRLVRRSGWAGTRTAGLPVLAGAALAVALGVGAFLGAGPVLPLLVLAGTVAATGVVRAGRRDRRPSGLLLAGLGTAAALLTSVVGGVAVAVGVGVALVVTGRGTARRVRGPAVVVAVVVLVLGVWAGAGTLLPATTTTVAAPASSTVSGTAGGDVLVPLLRAADTTWSAAVVEPGAAESGEEGPQWSARLQTASGTSVLPITTSGPTLGQVQAYVATGRVRYLVVPDGTVTSTTTDGGTAAEVTGWVAARYTTVAVATSGVTVYDLSSPLG